MYRDKRVAAVLPAYNESAYIESAVHMLAGEIFDDIIVVDDASTDATPELADKAGASVVISHELNRGVGGALVTGFKASVERGNDIAVVIPGDGQADLDALPGILDKTFEGYGIVISDRISGRDANEWGMPKYRIWGSRVLSVMTWIATGTRIPDPQSGYKAVTRATLEAIPLDDLVTRWGIHNDMISYCAVLGIPVTTAPALPVYRDDTGSRITSHIKLRDLIPRHLKLFFRMLGRRIKSSVGRGLSRTQ